MPACGLQRRLRRGAGVALLVTALATGCGAVGVQDDASGADAAASGEGTAASGSTDAAAQPRSEPVSDAVRNFEADTAYAEVPPPTRITIPSLGVESSLVELGRSGDGTVEVPARYEQAGWYAEGARPGQRGSAVVLGHVDSRAGPAVFADVHTLPPGAPIEVARADGTTATFEVERIEQHAKTRFPTADVYYPTLEPGLRLVTCGGDFDRASGHYEDNVIVFARLVEAPANR